MSEWEEYKLNEIATYTTGKINSNAEVANGTYPFFTCSPITLRIDDYAFDTEALILAGNNANGVFALKYYKGKFNAYQRTYVIMIKDLKFTDYKFLFYALKTQISNLELISHGTATRYLTLPILDQIPIYQPPLPEQKAIASVLSSLDDKIDLLHRQNKTLEAMAETLFRQWFVVEAQDDWEEGCLGDVIKLNYGKGLKKENRTGDGYPVVGSSGIVDYHSDYLIKGPGIVIGRKGTLGTVIYLWDNFYPIDTTYYISPSVNSPQLLYEYFLLKTLDFKEMNSDSAVPGLNRDIALSTEIKLAPIKQINKFNQFVLPFQSKMKVNLSQIHTIEKLRDTLLPKLMSGEVRVSL